MTERVARLRTAMEEPVAATGDRGQLAIAWHTKALAAGACMLAIIAVAGIAIGLQHFRADDVDL